MPSRKERQAYFRHLQATRKTPAHGGWGVSPGWGSGEFAENKHDYGGCDAGPGVYSNTAANWRQTDRYIYHVYSWTGFWSVAQDRAVRWSGVGGLSLAELSATFYPNHHPDYSAEHHATTSWRYIAAESAGTLKRSTSGQMDPRAISGLFVAAVAGRKPEDLIPPLRAADYPDLCHYAHYTRRFLRSATAPDGSAMYPMSPETYEHRIANTEGFSHYHAYDATVKKNPESAAHLSRSIQKAMRGARSPLRASRCSGPYYRLGLEHGLSAYYMVKHWGLPKELPGWQEVQARDGGTTFFRAVGGQATVTVRFFAAARKGELKVEGPAGVAGTVDAAALRKTGMRLSLTAGETVRLLVTGGPDRDRLGPYVDITAPRWKRDLATRKKGFHGHLGLWEPIKGAFTFKADAADRSGVAKIEFYLNNGQLIGIDTDAPYECEHEVKDTFCQYVYAIAHDALGNTRRSFEVPFGDGSVGPSLMGEEE
ncbi:MAG: Ig-like domain-containing protein [Planctomycetota bacterium]